MDKKPSKIKEMEQDNPFTNDFSQQGREKKNAYQQLKCDFEAAKSLYYDEKKDREIAEWYLARIVICLEDDNPKRDVFTALTNLKKQIKEHLMQVDAQREVIENCNNFKK